ncbi:hypothetical protein FDENT_4201 [Fusarium denticulatum]|uniref:F-box domain-containing protein n=1 Tax=Fusarium denticulatum TaxID=48507 RepID=A0A8H5UPC0_9HYPO|nr:hypothetical protein FDENT_4201 [Fusarium denticulatum]
MPHLRLDPQYSSSWIQRTIARFGLRQRTLEVSLLETHDGETAVHLDTPVPEDADLPAPLEPLKLGTQQSLGSRLLQLPPELLIHVMRFLPHSSLYMMRQTCQALRELTEDIEFDDFYWDILHFTTEQNQRFLGSTLLGSTCEQLRLIKRILLRSSLCDPCGDLLDSGELESRLRRLWQPIRCAGCNQNHPDLLFPQGNEKGNICVGLLGQFELCKHVKVSAKLQPKYNEEMYIRCKDTDHYPASSRNDEGMPDVTNYQPRIRTSYSGDKHAVDYVNLFLMVRINQRQFPGMPALQAFLQKQLKEMGVEGLCQHASTQINSIVSSMISDECNCFPATGTPVHKLEAPYGPGARCPNHGYNCRHCGAHYLWFYEGDYIVLRHKQCYRNTGPDSFGWLANLTFDTEEHPIFNDNTKGVLWCDDPSCGTGCGNRWLLMVEILKRASLRRHGGYNQLPPRDRYSAQKLPFTLEYQVFQEAAEWPTDQNMLSMDLMFPLAH